MGREPFGDGAVAIDLSAGQKPSQAAGLSSTCGRTEEGIPSARLHRPSAERAHALSGDYGHTSPMDFRFLEAAESPAERVEALAKRVEELEPAVEEHRFFKAMLKDLERVPGAKRPRSTLEERKGEVLDLAGRTPGILVKDLAREMEVSQSRVIQILDVLEGEDRIKRTSRGIWRA